MRVLVGCEFSGAVRSEFRKLGHDAWSCDLLPAEDGSEFHLQCDILSVLNNGWDLGVFFPPCTHLSVSGAKHFARKRSDGTQQQAIDFFLSLANAPIPRIAIENPIGIMSTVWRKPDCIIQPYEHGHEATKTTCLWLKNLPPLGSNQHRRKGRAPYYQRRKVAAKVVQSPTQTGPVEAQKRDLSGNRSSHGQPVVYASDCPPCPDCGEPWCPTHAQHYADCPCVGPNSEEQAS